VLPSYEEGFSNSLLEAMAVGCAVVATDVGGNPEALGDTGVLVPAGDPAQLAVSLKCLLEDPIRRESLGAAARSRAREEFSANEMVERHMSLYEDLLA